METNKSSIVFPYEVGPEQTQAIRLSAFNFVTQTRHEYNPDGIEELALSMLDRDETGTITGLRLVNPPVVGRFSKETAATYLDDLNNLFETAHSVDDLVPGEDGTYSILIAGHRRSLALARAVELCGATTHDLLVRTVVLENVQFAEAFKQQTIENIYERPAPQDEAEAIAKYCEFRQRKSETGEAISVAQCARELSLKETKVRNAIKYAELPKRVKDFVGNGVLSYSDGVIINDVQRAYRTREIERTKTNPAREDATDHLTETFAIHVINRRARKDVGEKFGIKQFLNMVKGEIDNVRQSIYHAEGFFEAEEVAATHTAQRAVAVSRLTDTMLALAGIVHDNDPEQIDAFVERLFSMIPDRVERELIEQMKLG